MTTWARLCAGLCLLAAMGCAQEVYAPPTRIAPYEYTRPMAADETGIRVSGGAGGAVFGPEATFFDIDVETAATETLMLNGSVMWLRVNPDLGSGSDDPNIFAGRLGARWNPFEAWDLECCASLTAGVGAGASSGGAFVSPDLGLVIAFDNDYLIPVLSVSGFVSQPLGEEPVDVSREDGQPGSTLRTAQTTWGLTGVFALRIPLRLPRVEIGFLGGIGLTLLDHADADSIAATHFSFGIDTRF